MTWRLDGPVLVVIQKQHQLIVFSLATTPIQLQLVAELTLEDCLMEGGADWIRYAFDLLGMVCYDEVRLVSTEGDEGRRSILRKVNWVLYFQRACMGDSVISICEVSTYFSQRNGSPCHQEMGVEVR